METEASCSAPNTNLHFLSHDHIENPCNTCKSFGKKILISEGFQFLLATDSTAERQWAGLLSEETGPLRTERTPTTRRLEETQLPHACQAAHQGHLEKEVKQNS